MKEIDELSELIYEETHHILGYLRQIFKMVDVLIKLRNLGFKNFGRF
jgi:hypothetical protein